MIEKEAPGWWFPRNGVSTRPVKAYDGQYRCDKLSIVFGTPGSGKTTMLIANLHRWGVEQGYGPFKAVYIALEGGEDAVACAEAHRQNIGILPDGGTPLVTVLPVPEFHLLDDAWLTSWLAEVDAGRRGVVWTCEDFGDDDETEQALADTRAAIEGPDVVVIDSLSRAIAGHDENSSAVMSQAVAAAERVQRAFGARALFLVHHPAGDSARPRGSSALFAAAYSAVRIQRRGDVVTVTNTKARGFKEGVVRQYRRRSEVLDTRIHESALWRMEFDEISLTKADKRAAPTAPRPHETVPSAPTPPEPKAAPPSAGLRGLPFECWKALALGAGQSMSEAAAVGTLKSHPCLGDVEARRRLVRIADVLKSWQTRGLMVGGVVTNPA